jgi:ABC-type phosphate transport system substrate-binding protein
MRTYLRVRSLALTALCAGGTIGAATLVEAPAQALAATPQVCSNLYGSGSTLQTIVEQQTLTVTGSANNAGFTAPEDCSTAISAFYNTNAAGGALGGTGSGAGLTEFGLQAGANGTNAVTPTSSQNGSFLDGFIGTDDPPTPAQMSAASTAAGSDPEPVPVLQAPIAIALHLPAGCTITTSPIVTNTDLAKALANTSSENISWNALLTDAGARPKGCSTTVSPTVQVRFDGSGTTFATRQYLSQYDPTFAGTVSDSSAGWPGTVQTTYTDSNGVSQNDQGSGGEAKAVVNTAGSIGYVNTADAVSNGINHWAAGASTFYVRVQNNGTSNTGAITGVNPVGSTNAGNCPTVYSGALPGTGTMPDWTGVHVGNPDQTQVSRYPLCTLTFDVAWHTYKAAPILKADYTAKFSGETAAGVENSAKDYLRWEVGNKAGQGQQSLPTTFYNALPPTIQKEALASANAQIGVN